MYIIAFYHHEILMQSIDSSCSTKIDSFLSQFIGMWSKNLLDIRIENADTVSHIPFWEEDEKHTLPNLNRKT